MMNVFFYFVFLLVLSFLEPLYSLIGGKEQSMQNIMLQSYLYVFTYKPMVTASNFLQGKTEEESSA